MDKRWLLSLMMSCSLLTDAQQSSLGSCVLSPVKNGQITTVHGKIVHAPHDMILDVPNCKSVVLVYAGAPEAPVFDPVLSTSRKSTLHHDSSFKKFERYVGAEYKRLRNGGVCNECPKYEVEATFTGSLEIANVPQGFTKDASGFLRDASGKVVGNAGFGHPPVYEYLMIIESVSDVVARKLPGPSSARVYSDLPAGPL